MKKFYNRGVMVILAIILLTAMILSSCDHVPRLPPNNTNEGAESQDIPVNVDSSEIAEANEETESEEALQPDTTPVIEFERYSTTPRAEMENPAYDEMYSFTAGNSDYYAFYLGRVNRTPLQNNSNVFEYIGNGYEKQFTSTVTNETIISEMLSITKQNCISTSLGFDFTQTLGSEALGVKISKGLSGEISGSQSISRQESIEKTVAYSESHTDTTTFSFDAQSKKGYYRYVLMGDVDVFVILVRNTQAGTYKVCTYEVISSEYYSLDYSPSSRFDDHEYKPLVFEVSKSKVDSLPKPTTEIKPEKNASYDSGFREITIDSSPSQEKVRDTFDISNINEYLNENYIIHFEVQIYMREIYKGYQEIYLCKNDETVVAGNSAYEYGGPGDANRNYSWVTFNWDVNGADCTEIMKLKFGGHGQNSDDWIRAHVKVNVTASYTD